MRWTEKIIAAIRDTFDTMLFFATMAVKEDFRNYVAHAGVEQMSSERRLAILGNGPSLKQQLPQLIEQQAWQKMDMMAVNFFALSEEYKVVCPKFYILSDPQFFRKAGRSERIEQLYNALAEQTTWPMTLYVQYYNPEKFDYAAAVKHNPKIRIVPFHSIVYHGLRSLEFWCYRRGLGSGNFGTVVQNGEFIGILGGSMIIEQIFGIPGVGQLYINSISQRDYNFFMALTFFYTFIGLLSGIVIDISYGFIDPRIRMGSKK
jgi:hypothetical protein